MQKFFQHWQLRLCANQLVSLKEHLHIHRLPTAHSGNSFNQRACAWSTLFGQFSYCFLYLPQPCTLSGACNRSSLCSRIPSHCSSSRHHGRPCRFRSAHRLQTAALTSCPISHNLLSSLFLSWHHTAVQQLNLHYSASLSSSPSPLPATGSVGCLFFIIARSAKLYPCHCHKTCEEPRTTVRMCDIFAVIVSHPCQGWANTNLQLQNRRHLL